MPLYLASSGGSGGGETVSWGAPGVGTTWAIPGAWLLGSYINSQASTNYLFYEPLIITSPLQVTALGLYVDTAVAGLARLGVYNATWDWIPGALVHDAGTVDTGTTGMKSTGAFDIELAAGLYLKAYATNATPTLRQVEASSPFGVNDLARPLGAMQASGAGGSGALADPGPAWSLQAHTQPVRHAVFLEVAQP